MGQFVVLFAFLVSWGSAVELACLAVSFFFDLFLFQSLVVIVTVIAIGWFWAFSLFVLFDNCGLSCPNLFIFLIDLCLLCSSRFC
jgi:hypothetical protein